MNVVAIIQARMGSTRLPGKVMRDICGTPMIQRIWDRLAECCLTTQRVIAVPYSLENQDLISFCLNKGLKYDTGPEEDVLTRYLVTADRAKADVIVRVTADCPLIIPGIVDSAVRLLLDENLDYVHNHGCINGINVEAFTMESFKYVDRQAKEFYERVHVTPFYYKSHPEAFRIKSILVPPHSAEREPKVRLCVDTLNDLIMVRMVYENLGNETNLIRILDFLKEHPEIVAINNLIRQKEIEEG